MSSHQESSRTLENCENCENSVIDFPETLEEKYHHIKQRIYLFAKDGFSLNLASLLNSIDNSKIRDILINQVNPSFFTSWL
jgi:hypothetical protein